MSKSKLLLIALVLLQASLIFSIKERSFLLLESDSEAACSCIVKTGFEAWGAYCSGNCNNQGGCATYSSFCSWSPSSGTNTSNSTNSSTPTGGCSCTVKSGYEAWGSHCSQSCNDQNACGTYSFYCSWSTSGSSGSTNTSTNTTVSCPNNCSSHGTCNTATGVCTCSSGYSGSNCATQLCLNNCTGHGSCTNGVCYCNSGYSGSDCSTASAISCLNNCSGNGVCNTVNGVCSCYTGYSGSDCSTVPSNNSGTNNTGGITYNVTGVIQVDPTCAADWQWCKVYNWTSGGWQQRNCCSPLQFCNTSDTSDWVGCAAQTPDVLSQKFFPVPNWPGENVCGADGTTWNKYSSGQDYAEPLEIAKIWVSATQGLSMYAHWQNKDGSWIRADKPGGMGTCIESVSLALGECGHSNHNAPHCSINGSGPGGFWQVTSQDTMDSGLARCTNGLDPCCNARIAYAHAWQTGFANTVPTNYCDTLPGNCGIDPQGTLSGWVKNQSIRETVSKRKNGAIIPLCDHSVNPWYTASESAAALYYATQDQEPCYWGPFGIAGGGYVKSFFINFNYAGSYFQHYTDSAWGCDPSPQVPVNERCYDSYTGAAKSYYQTAVEACAAVIGNITYVPPAPLYNGSSSSSNSSTNTSTSIACPSNCSSKGTCNTATGICTCNSGYNGSDCSNLIVLSCPSNCLSNGVCNTSTGVCACNSGWSGVDCGVSTSSSNSSSNQNFEHSIYALTWTAWNPQAIFGLFTPACLGLAKQIYLAFGAPDQTLGISFAGQSPNTTVWYQNQNMPAINVYKQAIVGLNQAAGVQTLLSIGGWTYASYFAFLANLNPTQMAAWAQQVRVVVDSFGAQGIDLDYEADTVAEWHNIMVKNNVIGALRAALPKPYIIKLTLPYGSALNLTSDKIGPSFNPPFQGGWAAQTGVELVVQNLKDIDSINIMSYGNDPNLDPMQALNLNRQQINQYMNMTNSQTVLNLGGMIGPQPGCTTNWCNWQISHTTSASAYVKQQGYHGMFWWPDSGSSASQIPYYQEAYKQMFGTTPTPVSVPGVC